MWLRNSLGAMFILITTEKNFWRMFNVFSLSMSHKLGAMAKYAHCLPTKSDAMLYLFINILASS